MRLWSIHPSYLDARGLVALWREGLLARKVLLGKTKGYRAHPQLIRFRSYKNALEAIDAYLEAVIEEAIKRQYRFDETKIIKRKHKSQIQKISVTRGQLEFEMNHLRSKLRKRNLDTYTELEKIKNIKPHPLFKIIKGNIEPWEKQSSS